MISFPELFANLKDPRRVSHSDHPLINIVIIVLLSMLCGAKGWDDMYLWAWGRRHWLGTFLDLSQGVPSADTFRRVMSALDPKSFREGFQAWAKTVVELVDNLHIAVDGKTIRGSARSGSQAVHIVRAFVVNNHLVLGQLATDEKSNEITAIPELLKTLALQGALVTIDAMGAQHAIADTIVERGGDYLLAIKDNQPTLHAELQAELGSRPVPARSSTTFCQKEEEAHGRFERRRVWTETRLQKMETCSSWTQATTIIRVESQRTTDKGSSIEDRYYLCSRKLTARAAFDAIRNHWSIENVCHWSLDVTLEEDACRIADGYAAENLSLIRSLVLAALKQCPEKLATYAGKKLSLKQKQKVCGWDNAILMEVACGLFQPT